VSESPGTASPRREALLGSSALLALGLAVGQVLGYALNVVGARVLGPALFGELGALLGILLIGNVVALAVQAVVARHVARGGDAADHGRVALAAGAVETVLALLLVPAGVVLLHLGVAPLAALAFAFLPLTLTGLALGTTQGHDRFVALSTQYAVIAVLRSGLALTVLLVTSDVTATVLAVLVGSVLGWLTAAPLARVRWPRPGHVERETAWETSRATFALLAMFVLTSADVLLARAILSADDAGQYAAGAILAKIAFWLPQAVVIAAFPRLARNEAGALRRATLLLTALGATEVAGAALLGPWLVPRALGPDYTVAASHAWVFVLAGVALSLASLVLYDRLADDDPRTALLVWAAVAVLIALVLTFGRTSPTAVAWCVVGAASLLTAAGAALRTRRPQST
jgi:O-antigen/teichoic acid export membrane protein